MECTSSPRFSCAEPFPIKAGDDSPGAIGKRCGVYRFYRGNWPDNLARHVSESSDQAGSRTPSLKYSISMEMIN
jgi:hypothetical protein